ncbi:LOW QUALITY PROTEIN: hypothetical protein MAR_018737 [Mya arenaria]|uniref:Uncharacterized protein n=1 Tax=Mya arenaria TaxID=6604 RepID=A0ABY7EK49_MYAAR|nr:LOW QUALITY PROTEIN: hypothetical protein MAR_018737 [Mya arenaria]
MTFDPKPISQLDLSKPRLPTHHPVSTKGCVEFDPRHSTDRQKMKDLKAVFSQTGMAHVAPIPDSAPPAVQEMEVETIPDPILENIMVKEVVVDKSMPCDCQKGVLELECPYSVDKREFFISGRFVEHSIFLHADSDSGPALYKTHHIYALVQGTMAVTGLPWCDFVVWTGGQKNNLFVQRIYFDSNFVSDMLRKLKGFYNNFIKSSA